MWLDQSCPLVIAHRGDKSHAPENTLSAFKQAAEKGADAIEFDVKLTADGHVIILHDQKVDRTTDGKGDLRHFPLAALQDLDAGLWYSEQFRGERIPTVEQVFEMVGQRIYMNIELTNYAAPGDELIPKVVELVKKHGLQGRVLFSSFFARNLRKARALLPEVPRGLLAWPGWMGLPARTFGWRGDYFALHPYFSDVSAGLVDRLHAQRKRLNVWTVNAQDDLKRMVGLGVEGVITDDPGLALRLIGRSK